MWYQPSKATFQARFIYHRDISWLIQCFIAYLVVCIPHVLLFLSVFISYRMKERKNKKNPVTRIPRKHLESLEQSKLCAFFCNVYFVNWVDFVYKMYEQIFKCLQMIDASTPSTENSVKTPVKRCTKFVLRISSMDLDCWKINTTFVLRKFYSWILVEHWANNK